MLFLLKTFTRVSLDSRYCKYVYQILKKWKKHEIVNEEGTRWVGRATFSC